MNPAAILALISELYARVGELTRENATLRAAIQEAGANRTTKVSGSSPAQEPDRYSDDDPTG